MKRGGLGRAAALAAAIFGSIAVAGGTVAAQDVDLEALENVPALITADELTYDETNGLVVAAGNVEISQSDRVLLADKVTRSEEHTSELQSLMRISYAVFCLKKNKTQYLADTE